MTRTEPTLSRRHAAGAESARGLLLTVLGEFVLPADGTAWTSVFIDVLGRLGVEEKATRQALMRTAADGWLTSERVGRRTRWRLTPAGEQLLTEGTERIYSFTGAMNEWDGDWLLVLARAPETERNARHLLRTRLTWAGFGSPSPGVWISPHADRVAEAESVLADAGLLEDSQVFRAAHVGSGPLATMVGEAWDLDAVEAEYEEFIARFAREDPSSPTATSSPSTFSRPSHDHADPLASMVELVHAWRRFPQIDPALPRELLPDRWSGTEAARLFESCHARWATGATEAWRAIDTSS